MKKVLVMVALVMVSVIVYAFNDSRESNQGKKEVTGNGEVVVMDKDMFHQQAYHLCSKQPQQICRRIIPWDL